MLLTRPRRLRAKDAGTLQGQEVQTKTRVAQNKTPRSPKDQGRATEQDRGLSHQRAPCSPPHGQTGGATHAHGSSSSSGGSPCPDPTACLGPKPPPRGRFYGWSVRMDCAGEVVFPSSSFRGALTLSLLKKDMTCTLSISALRRNDAHQPNQTVAGANKTGRSVNIPAIPDLATVLTTPPPPAPFPPGSPAIVKSLK